MNIMKYEYNLLYTIEKILSDLPKAERIVASYILDHREKITNMNIHELSDKSGGTSSAVTRLCKRINVKGYSHLRLQIMSELSRKTSAYGENKKDNNVKPEMVITHSVIEKAIGTLEELESLIDVRTIKKVADIITKAGKIDIYGIGASSLVADDLQMKLMRIGISSNFYHSEHLQITSSCNLSASDVVIAISFSGETSYIIKAVEMAKSQKATVVSMTSNVANPLAEYSDISLFVPVSESSLRTGAMSSRIAQLTLVDILYYYVTQINPEETINKLIKTKDSLRGNI